MSALEVSVQHQLAGFRLAVDLAVDREVLVLLGRSGAGKSMTLQAVAGLIRPPAGRIVLNGRVVFDDQARVFLPPQARRVGYVPQSYALFPHLTVFENVAFGLRGVSRAEARRRVADLLELTGLTALAHRRPHQLSGGQQQRVALARALAPQPEALLLDEPLSALDAPTRIELRRALRSLQRQFAVPTLFVTHDLSEALALGDRIAVIDAGRVLQVGTPGELLGQFRDVRVAELTGVRNRWRGQLAWVAGNRAGVRVGDRVIVGQPVDPTLPPGAPVWVCVRSEAVRLVESDAPACGATAVGTVVDVVIERNAVVLSARLAGSRLAPEREYDLEIEVPRLSWECDPRSPGQEVILDIAVEAVRILPATPDIASSPEQ
jgi:molybdate transport system ATP-binding protein